MNPELLHAYLDGELGPEETSRVEAALRADPALAEELRALRSVDGALDQLPSAQASDGFTDRVVHAARYSPFQRAVRWGAALAAAAAILLAVYLAPGSDPSTEPVQIFSGPEHLANYIWEADEETYGSLALEDLEDRILEELEST